MTNITHYSKSHAQCGSRTQPRGKSMKRRLTATMLLASLAITPLAMTMPASGASAQDISSPSRSVVLSIGRGELISVPGSMADVFIANDTIADVQIKSQRQLYVFGKAGGETTIYASNAAGDIIWSANIRVGSNIDSIDQMLALAMPQAKVAVATMGTNTVLLTGTVAAPEDASEAERLVQAFVGEEMNVITRLKMATPLQVNLQVRFAEVSRSLVREINGNLATRDQSGGFLFGTSTGRNFATIGDLPTAGLPQVDASANFGLPPGTVSLPFNPATGQFVVGGTQYAFNGNNVGQSIIQAAGSLFGLDVAAAFDLAERTGLITTLSQPNLTALSGETADFLAGGEFPIPVSQGLGTTTVEYRKFGVSLSYTPTVLANGRISIRVRPEISELSSQGAVNLGGFQIPALTIRRVETTVELGSGQSFMIAGLMSNSAQNTIEKAPGLGDVPILGNLFRSTSFRKGETELVIVVTPYLVEPVDASEIRLPTDGFGTATTLQRTLGFQDNAGVTGGERPSPTVRGARGTPPDISQVDPQAVMPVPPAAGPASRAASGNPRRDRRAEADTTATPGFSIQ